MISLWIRVITAAMPNTDLALISGVMTGVGSYGL